VAPEYEHVFAPISIGPIEVPNRFFMPAHGLALVAGGPHGSKIPSQECVSYYAERARGGVGLLYHSTCINPRDALASAYYEGGVPAYQAVADAVHEHGSKFFGQISYYYNHRSAWEPLSPSAPVLGVSEFQNFQFHFTCHLMSTEVVRELVQSHARCAANLAAAGYDGIEVHAAHGMLVEQFLSPYFNKRTDEYGGDVENRMRFLVECLQAVRDAVGPGLAVGMRFNCDEMLPGGLTQEDTRDILSRIVAMGLVDFVNLDISVEPQQGPFMVASQFLAPHHMQSFIDGVGPAASDTVVMGTPGRLTTVADADRFIAAGIVDMVGAVRELIAEPELVNNAREGRDDRSRTCTACNFCIASFEMGAGWGCTINPGTGRESRWGVDTFSPAAKRSKVVVVGGGPAGMEAARVAAMRGHEVLLLERSEELGGQLAMWASLPSRDTWFTTIEWYWGRLGELGVDVRTGVDGTAEGILAEQPDAVIIATGSRYDTSGETGFMAAAIPGSERDFVYTPEQIIEGGARPTGRVLVLDEEGINTAAGIAQLLAEAGAQIEFVTREFQPYPTLLFSMESVFIDAHLKSMGAVIRPQTYIKEIGDHEVVVFDITTNVEQTLTVDAVVLATMRKAQSTLLQALEGRVSQLFVVGDAASPRGLAEATYEAQRFARFVGEEGAPRTLAEAWFLPSPTNTFTSFGPAVPAAAAQPVHS
jgi:2,4-dienoyl-CoA reductase-like NADH-dependent reductase (Old Yellow Enzyme family)/thioredoxin reductase